MIAIMMQNQQFLQAEHYVKPSANSICKLALCKQKCYSTQECKILPIIVLLFLDKDDFPIGLFIQACVLGLSEYYAICLGYSLIISVHCFNAVSESLFSGQHIMLKLDWQQWWHLYWLYFY